MPIGRTAKIRSSIIRTELGDVNGLGRCFSDPRALEAGTGRGSGQPQGGWAGLEHAFWHTCRPSVSFTSLDKEKAVDRWMISYETWILP